MKRFLLFICFLVTTSLVCAQTISDKFTLSYQQKTDDMVYMSWKYTDTTSDTKFEVFKHRQIQGGEWEEVKSIERVATGWVENPTPNTEFTCTLDGLYMSVQTNYKFSVKATTKLQNDEVITHQAFVYISGGQVKAIIEEASATIFTFKYGLQAPTLSENKSSSVKISWNSACDWGTPAFYTLFERNTNVQIATTTELSYLVTDLIPETNYSFFVRAYDANGAYLSSSPDVAYKPETVECLTFDDLEYIEGSFNQPGSIYFRVLGLKKIYSYPKDFKIFMGDEEADWTGSSLDENDEYIDAGFISEIDPTKEFRVETVNINNGHKAVGFFKLKADGTAIAEQRCDIVFDVWVSHITQYTATLEWTDPGFEPDSAKLVVTNLDKNKSTEITIQNPKVFKYSLGNLEHSTNYKFELKLKDEYNNMAKSDVTAKTKVGNICEVTNETSRLGLGCSNDGEFVAPYDIEFYTEYEKNADGSNGQAKVTVRFRLLDATEVSKVQLIYTKEGNIISEIINLKRIDMTKGEDGWYSTTFTKLGSTDMKDGEGMYFSVLLTPAKRCSYLLNVYITKLISYTVGVGCQDEAKFTIIKFTKTYAKQSQFTLQTNGRMASVGVFTEDGYLGDESFDLTKRIFYNNFDDAPSKFTLDISEYEVGTYYMHIHDVYGEVDDLKYLWAIY